MVVCMINLFGKRLKEYYLGVGEVQVERINSLVTMNTISTILKESYSQVSFIIEDNNLSFNTGELNLILKDSVNRIYEELKKIESGESMIYKNEYGKGIIYEIPFHMFSNNVLVSSYGPKIPIKYQVIGDVKGEIISQIESFGINNAVVNLLLSITISSRIAVPLQSKIISSKINLPIYSRIFEGEVPHWGYSNIESVDEQYSEGIKI